MSTIYLMDGDSKTVPLERVRCKDESKELQALLESNPDLLPGEQIDPDAPRRWLLIKREMPVTDPATGVPRWSIDLFFADQFGIPTLVECKRCNDTRSRREVVAQMLEYAANGHHYWTASEMRSLAESTAGGAEQLNLGLRALREGDDQSVEEFFGLVEQNLREAKMRLVFFLEESPNELRSLVDFMNRQLKDTEVLLVEARQYQQGKDRIVVPWLFGFTEEARVAKRESRAQTIRAAGERGEEAFWKAIRDTSLPASAEKVIHDFVASLQADPNGRVSWGASAIYVLPKVLSTRGLFAITRSGSLELYFGYWDETKYGNDVGPLQVEVRDLFIALIEKALNISFSEKQRHMFPKVAPEKWLPHKDQLLDGIRALSSKYIAAAYAEER